MTDVDVNRETAERWRRVSVRDRDWILSYLAREAKIHKSRGDDADAESYSAAHDLLKDVASG